MFLKSNKIINTHEIDDLRLKTIHESTKITENDVSKELPRHKKGEMFLKGPIPMNWLKIALNLPGKSLHVAIGVWHLGSLNKQRTVKLSMKMLREFGVKRNAAYRALDELESAKLIRVKRRLGRCSTVTVLDFNDENL